MLKINKNQQQKLVELTKLVSNYGYWSKQVEEFNQTLNQRNRVIINNIVLSNLKEGKI